MIVINRLIVCLLRWREENPSIVLEYEVDALRRDSYGYTPLAWACTQGHREAALLLYRWNSQALTTKNDKNHTPLQIATLRGSFQKYKFFSKLVYPDFI